MLDSIPALREADKAIAQIENVLRARFHTTFDRKNILQIILISEGLARIPKNFGDITEYEKVISRVKVPLFGAHVWKMESGQCLNSINLSYEKKLVLLHELSKMMAGYFHNAILLRRSKNKLQMLLESQTHYGLKILYMMGVKRRNHLSPITQELKEHSYESYVRLIKVTPLEEAKTTYGFKFIQRFSQIWKSEDYSFSVEELWPMTEQCHNPSPAEKETGFILHGGQLKDSELTNYLNNTKLAPVKYYMHEPLREGYEYFFDPDRIRWDSRKIETTADVSEGKPAIPSRRTHPQYNWYINTKLFSEFLQSIPNFRINLTKEQLEVVQLPGNVVLIGRSGTGKTTTSVLRLFALEVIYKLKTLRLEDKEAVFKSEHMDRPVGLHSIFATASPVLTNEIYRYYRAVVAQVKEELRKKEERLKLMKQQSKEENKSEVLVLDGNSITEIVKELHDEPQEESILTLHQQMINAELQKPHESNLESGTDQNISQKYSSLRDVTDSDFPLFLTIKQLIFMLDQCLQRPFFYRSTLAKGASEKRSGWYSEEKGVMFIDNFFKKLGTSAGTGEPADNFESESEEQMRNDDVEESGLYRNRNIGSTGKRKTFQVDYEYFRSNFWDLVRSAFYYRKINCHLVWTEIYSVIKGSIHSGTYGMTLDQYMRHGNQLLTVDQRNAIYQVFTRYQSWKFHVGAYDLMDVVNYILQELTYARVSVALPSIDYIMIDEVQDLCCATIKLLTKLCHCNIFCSGDSAQTIAKGVGFRFGDLKSIVQSSDGSFDGGYKQLTQNFRSQNSILQLAHTMIEVLQQFFSETIDVLKKETSQVQGPKPILLSSDNSAFIHRYFVGTSSQQLPLQKLEFGCQQVVIVRNQESKKLIPTFLKYALVLTIYECKGLQFNDVIICNFFAESTANWSLLHFLTTKSGRVVLDENKKLNQKNFMYSQLCSDLKLLYTAVTRAKRSLILYDANEEKRYEISTLWKRLGLVMTPQQILAADGIFTGKSSSADWNRQGYKMLSKQLYEQALDCFEKAENTEMVSVCQAYLDAEKAVQLMKTIHKNKIAAGTKSSNKKSLLSKKAIKELKVNSVDAFVSAAHKFASANRLKESARCFFSAKKFEDALLLFERLGLHVEVAECLYMLKDYAKAFEAYGKVNNLSKQIECLDLLEDWEGILKLVNENREGFAEEERNSLVTKYCNLAYARLMRQISTNFQLKEQAVEEKPKSKKKDVVEEEDQEDDESQEDFDDRKKEAADIVILEEEKRIEDERLVEEQHKKELEEQSENVLPEDSSVVELKEQLEQSVVEISEEVQQLKPQPQESFNNLNQDLSSEVESLREEEPMLRPAMDQSKDSFILLNEPDLESVRSYTDPEDQFLGNSLSQIRKGTFSEYSVIGQTIGVRASMIKTKGNIFLEESVMKRLIKIVEASSLQLNKYLRSLRAQKTLLTLDSKHNQTQKIEEDFIEQISPKLVGLVLDTLESFGYYRMCIFVCNRYSMPERLGRYLVSIANQYSTISGSSMKATFNLLSPGELRKSLLEKSVIASVAIHNAFEIINPQFFSLNDRFENALGKYCVKGLLYLGMYKKAVFMMSVDNCLQLLSVMFDWNMYAEVFLSKVRCLKKFEVNEKYPAAFYCQEQLSAEGQVRFTILAVERQVELMVATGQYGHFINQRIANEKLFNAGQHINILPKYFKRLRSLAENRYNSHYFSEFLETLNHINLKKLERIDRYDLVTTSLLVLSTLTKDVELMADTVDELISGGVSNAAYVVEFYKALLGYLQRFRTSNTDAPVVSDIISVYGMKLVNCQYLEFLGDSIVVQRGSTIADQAIKTKKTLFVIEQGMNVLAGDRRLLLTVLMERISGMLDKLKEVILSSVNSHLEQAHPQTKEQHSEMTKKVLLCKYLDNTPMKKQHELAMKRRYSKVKVGSMRRSMLTDDYYMKEAEISEDEEDQINKEKGVDLLEPLSSIPSVITNFVLSNYSQKAQAVQNYVILLQAGLHRYFSEMTSGTDNENLFQAIEFRKFGMLDDYLYHLELSLQLKNLPYHFELCCQAVCLLGMRLIIDTTHKKILQVNESVIRYFDVKDQQIMFSFSSLLSVEQNIEILGKLLLQLSSYSNVSSPEHRAVLLGTIQLVILNIPDAILKHVAHELSMLRPFLQYMAIDPLKSTMTKAFTLTDHQFILDLGNDTNWLQSSLQQIGLLDVGNHQTNERNANRDYEEYEASKEKRLKAAAKIKQFIKLYSSHSSQRKNWVRLSQELIAHLNSEFYQRSGLTSLDVHFILSQIEKLCQLQRQGRCRREAFQAVADETSSWMANEGEKFEVRELRIKAIREVKWFTRSNIGRKSKAVTYNKIQ